MTEPPERRRPSWFRGEHWNPQAVGRAIEQRRDELGLSRKEVARLSGFSYPYIYELEKGTKHGSSTALSAVAEALGLRHHELLERAESTPPQDTLARLAALRARIREALADATPAEAEAALLMSLGEQRVRASGADPAPPERPRSSP